MSNSYYFSKSPMCYITLFLLLHVVKMSFLVRTEAVDIDEARQQHIQ